MKFVKLSVVCYGGYFQAGTTDRSILVSVDEIARIAESDDGTYIYLKDGDSLFSKRPFSEIAAAFKEAGLVIEA
ncbi:MAG: hypothetical protein QXY39_02745 [Thermofilaceae archaeon]